MGCAEGALRQRLRGLLIGMINLSRQKTGQASRGSSSLRKRLSSVMGPVRVRAGESAVPVSRPAISSPRDLPLAPEGSTVGSCFQQNATIRSSALSRRGTKVTLS
jgi:hypothetical protein